jgi:hypothetical protein
LTGDVAQRRANIYQEEVNMKHSFRKTGILTAIAGLSLLVASATPAVAQSTPTTTAATTAKKGCDTGRYSPIVRNRPAGLAPGAAQGAYLWHDENGWHLRVTHPSNDLVTFSGAIDSSNHISEVGRALEGNDEVKLQKQRGRVLFELSNYGRIDGIDFRVGCSNSFTVSLKVNGQPIVNTQVFIGSDKVNPTSVPFRVERS